VFLILANFTQHDVLLVPENKSTNMLAMTEMNVKPTKETYDSERDLHNLKI
jgi:hypothetical protein